MADTEKNEDQKISRCLQEAFGYTDEQLLKQLDQANETLKDVTFDGAEDRIMKKIMARKAELEKETSAPEPETERNITLVKAETEDRKDKKIVRFGKKKVLATVALVAVIAGMLGGTAVGKKNYFLRRTDTVTPKYVLDNDKNKTDSAKIEDAYHEIKEKLGITVLKISYYPKKLSFIGMDITEGKAVLKFMYEDKVVGFIQEKKEKGASIALESDRKGKKKIYNEWIGANIEYNENILSDGQSEFEMMLIKNNVYYYMMGVMPEEEFKNIIKNLNFY